MAVTPNNQLKFIKNVIYNLKRDYGGPLDIYQISNPTLDIETGKQTVERTKYPIRRAIRLPRDIHRDSLWSAVGTRVLPYAGSIIELADREVIIDMKDLPRDFVMGEEGFYIIIDQLHYSVKKVSLFDFRAALYIVLKEITGAQLEQVIQMTVTDNVTTAENRVETTT